MRRRPGSATPTNRSLRDWSKNNLPVPCAELQHYWIIDLDGMFFAVDADDVVDRRGTFGDGCDRRRGDGLLSLISATGQQIRRGDAPTVGRATQAQTRRVGFG